MDYYYLGENHTLYNILLLIIIFSLVSIYLIVFVYKIKCFIQTQWREINWAYPHLELYKKIWSIIKSGFIRCWNFWVIHKLLILLCLIAIVVITMTVDLMLEIFNNGKWRFSYFTPVSTNIGNWGDFATCLASIFALISIFFAYRAFRSQTRSARRNSFDSTFTEIFAQHKVLHDKAVQHEINFISRYDLSFVSNGINNNIFSICKDEYRKFVSNRGTNVSRFWVDFNQCDIGVEVSIDFKNYFKYIYHEINIVVSQPDEILDENAKWRYIQLIQAQMNYDELFCYLINQIEYIGRFNGNDRNPEMAKRANKHAENLRKYGFFYELCKSSSGHTNLVKRVFNCISIQVIPDSNIFIDNKWFYF